MLAAEAVVHSGTPGLWQYTRAFLAPDRYGWRIVTTAEPLTSLCDGTLVRSYVGMIEVSRDGGSNAPLRSHARWTAVVNLDVLRDPGVAIETLPGDALPAGVREGLIATFDDGAVYRLGFDDAARLVWAEGYLDLSPIGSGRITARFDDYRHRGPLLLPFAAQYWIGDLRIADETIRAACVDPPELTAASFTDPALLPDCR